MGVPGDEICYLISTFITDSENIYIDYKINGTILAEHSNIFINNLFAVFNDLKIILFYSNVKVIQIVSFVS